MKTDKKIHKRLMFHNKGKMNEEKVERFPNIPA